MKTLIKALEDLSEFFHDKPDAAIAYQNAASLVKIFAGSKKPISLCRHPSKEEEKK